MCAARNQVLGGATANVRDASHEGEGDNSGEEGVHLESQVESVDEI